ncbi:MAG: protein kinase [Byssovorax sp.]
MRDPSKQQGILDGATGDATVSITADAGVTGDATVAADGPRGDAEPLAQGRVGVKLGPFLLLEKCGQGAMGLVYAARDLRNDSPVAVKVLPAAFLADLKRARRFAAEAEVLASLDHPAIVRHVAHGTTPHGELFLAMQWLEGDDLSRILRHRTFSVREVAVMGQRIAEGLAAAHARGVVHRDIKPSNLFLRGGEAAQVLILDFGIARVDQAPLLLTDTGMVIGTPGYMAPEQARGAPGIDARADLFSLGAVLFECLAGRPAFTGHHVMAVLAKVLLEEPPQIVTLRPDVPPALDALVARLLAKDPGDRPSSAAVVAAALARMSLDEVEMEAASVRSRAGIGSSSITGSEQRFLCVVVVRAPHVASEEMETSPAQASMPTRPVPCADDVLVALEGVAAPLGARVFRLLDGSVIATFKRSGNAADEAVRAARCALALKELLPGVPLAVATGLGDASAPVPVGQVLDRAAGLVRTSGTDADAGAWVDEVTAGLIDARFVVRSGPRGRELVEERGTGEGARSLLGRPSPCVGRERQLRSLVELLDECVAEGVARAVLVKAPAGGGKSRLLREFLATASRRDDRVSVWIGRGDPLSAGSAFALLASALRHATAVRDGESVEVRRRKLTARIARHVAEKDQARVAAFLGELMATPFPADELPLLRSALANPVIMGEQVRYALEDFVVAECAAGPVLLALEDLHWGDLPSVKLIDGVLNRLRDRPFLMVAVGRPEIDDLFPQLWAERGVQEIRLAGLPRRAAEQLVRHALGEGASADTVTRIVERAAGNAFYLEELIRAVAEGRGEALPETVLAMVQARLDALDADDRLLLRAASVFGETFWRGGVVTLLGGATKWTESIGAKLDALVAREVFVRHEESRFPGEHELAFRHALLREGAYATLVGHDRTVGHRLAGAWLGERGESDPMVLAEHFERGGQPAKAEVHYLRAAQQAFLGGDLSATLARADQGLACVADGQHRLDLFDVRARTLYSLGELDGSAAQAEEILRLAPRWSRAFCVALAGKLLLAQFHGRPRAIVEVMREFGDVAPSAENAASLLQLYRLLQLVLTITERLDLAEHYFELSEQASREASPQDLTAQGYIAAIRAEHARAVEGDPWKALTLLHRAIAHFEEAGEWTSGGLMRCNAGILYTLFGAYDRAEAELRRSIQTMPGIERWTPRMVLVWTLAARGAMEESAEAEAFLHETEQTPGGESLAWSTAAYALRLRGDLEGAARWAEAALKLPPMFPRHRETTLATLASVRLSQGRVAEALAAAREAMSQEEPPRLRADHEPLIRLVYVEALHASGDQEGARAALGIARARLLGTADKIGDPELRRSFLEDVAENARTIRLAEERLGPVSERG